jgi:NitT/TauT family transport system substrate-binding protein
MACRIRLPILAALAAAIVAAALGPGSVGAARPLAQTQRITITTPSSGLHEMPLIVGMRRGLYAEEGLEVQRVQMAPPVSVAAVIAGDGDYAVAVGSTTTAVVGAGAPLKIVQGWAVRSLQVLVTTDPAIQSVADLRGRPVGTATLTDTTANLLRLALRVNGLEPQTDVPLQPLGESPNRLAALQTGQVVAVMLDLAQASEAQLRGARIIVPPNGFPEFPISGVALTEERLRTQPQQVEAVVRASLRGIHYMLQHRDDTVALLMEHLGLSREAAEGAYDLGMGTFAPDGLISDAGLQLMIDAARDTTGRPTTLTPAQLADFSIVRRVLAQLGL